MRNFLIILFSFILAMMLAILPLPRWASVLWPDWVLLVLIYWTIMMPHRVSVGWAWIIGLLLDVLFGSILGLHALAFVCVAYVMARFSSRIRFFSILQQMAVIFVLLVVYRVITNPSHMFLYWLPVITSTIFWPWIFALLSDYFRVKA
jgi:rod shape-determining protein MreD